MYFAYGWPRAFDVGGSTASQAPLGSGNIPEGDASDAAQAAGADAARAIVQILSDDDNIVILTGSSVQVAYMGPVAGSLTCWPRHLLCRVECMQGRFSLQDDRPITRLQMWSGGMHRIRLGAAWRSPGAVQTEGANKRAFWSSSRRLLAVIVGLPGAECLLASSLYQQ